MINNYEESTGLPVTNNVQITVEQAKEQYLRWFDTWKDLDDFDAYIDEDRERQTAARISPEDITKWNERKHDDFALFMDDDFGVYGDPIPQSELTSDEKEELDALVEEMKRGERYFDCFQPSLGKQYDYEQFSRIRHG